MSDLNKTFLSGRIGLPIEEKELPSGDKTARISLGVNRDIKDGNNFKEVTDWYWLSAFRSDAQYLIKYGKVGCFLVVECSLKTYKDKNDHQQIDIVIDKVKYLSKKD